MLTCTLVVAALACANDHVSERADPAAAMVLARSKWNFTRPGGLGGRGQQLVIHSGKELAVAVHADGPGQGAEGEAAAKSATDLLGRSLGTSIDWSKHILLVVTAGTKRSGGYRVEVMDLKVKGRTLTVLWKVHSPRGFATAVLSHPGEVVLVPRFDDKVRFDPPAGK